MSGFIMVHRDAFDHHLLQDAARFHAWLWLIAHACWKPSKIRIKGETIELKRGEISFSIRFLAQNWGWSKSKTARFIADLREEGMIQTRPKNGTSAGHRAGQGQSVITICNYEKYQGSEGRRWDSGEVKSGTKAGQAGDKEEEGKKGKRKKEPNGSMARVRAKRPHNISENVWRDFVAQRKSIFTDTALVGLLREAKKAGWSPEEAMREATEREWRSFKAEWVKENGNGHSNRRGSAATGFDTQGRSTSRAAEAAKKLFIVH